MSPLDPTRRRRRPLPSARPAGAPRPAALALVLAALAALAACGGGDGPTRPPAVARVAFAHAADTVVAGGTVRLAVTLADAAGAPLVGRRITFVSADVAVATVDSTGLVTAVAPGVTAIVAESEGMRAAATVVVRPKPVARVAVDGGVDTLWLGRTLTLRARTLAADGASLDGRTVEWSTPDTAVVVLAQAPDGGVMVRGVGLGPARVVARAEGIESSVAIAVRTVPVARLTLAAPDTLVRGNAGALRVTAVAPDGATLGASDLAGRVVRWTTDAPAVLAVDAPADAAGSVGAAARALAVGSASVTATLDGQTAKGAVVVVRPTVARLAFGSGSASLRVGDTLVVTATAADAEGRAIPDAPVTYAVGSDATVRLAPVTVDGAAAARLVGAVTGPATVSASVDGRTATLAVSVQPPAPTVRVLPSSVVALPGARGRLSAAVYPAGSTQQMIAPAVAWRSTNPAVATVDGAGRIATVGAGQASIVVTSEGGSTTVPITVQPPFNGAFRIDLRPVGAVPAAVMAAARVAAARWERAIVGALPLQSVVMQAGECDVGTPALTETVQNVVVFVSVTPIDGARNVLAYAGPCLLRPRGGLPVVGALVMDAADVSLLTDGAGTLAQDVLAHEMGHVLGIGTIWDGSSGGTNFVPSTFDPTFTGAAAREASARVGFTASASLNVPVEDLGGAGTAFGHWRERTFHGELMTGWLDPAPNPLSIVTVLALRDLGYLVTETGADIVGPDTWGGGTAFLSGQAAAAALDPGASRSRAAAPIDETDPGMRIGERLLRPTREAGADGRPRPLAPRATNTGPTRR